MPHFLATCAAPYGSRGQEVSSCQAQSTSVPVLKGGETVACCTLRVEKWSCSTYKVHGCEKRGPHTRAGGTCSQASLARAQ